MRRRLNLIPEYGTPDPTDAICLTSGASEEYRDRHTESGMPLLARARILHSVAEDQYESIQKPIFMRLQQPKCSRLHHQSLSAYRGAGL